MNVFNVAPVTCMPDLLFKRLVVQSSPTKIHCMHFALQDRGVTEIDQLVCKLSQPDMDRRGRLHFKSEELSPYKLMLG